ncbi:hypothetical protein, partial [Cetobacterium sp.]|uniref:hypothetical protein n=1 Tax=Cetobacterium sp. TaxID=2071632 RepID=UPI003F2E810A
ISSILLRSYFIFLLLLVKEKNKLYIYFYNILTLLCFCSLIQYICYNLGIRINLSKIIPDNPDKAKLGIIYLKSYFVVFLSDGYSILKRFQLIFEEPGTLGTLIGMVLLFDENYKQNRFKRIILILSGFLTQSTAFFILYLLKLFKGLFFKNSKKISISILLILFFISQSIYFINKKIYIKNYNKIFFVLEKNNREGEKSKEILNKFIYSKDVILGMGNHLYEDYKGINISSWRLRVYFNGILGMISLLLFVLVISKFKTLKREVKLSILIYFTSLYQRPAIETLANLLILVSGSYYYNFYLNQVENKKSNSIIRKLENEEDIV